MQYALWPTRTSPCSRLTQRTRRCILRRWDVFALHALAETFGRWPLRPMMGCCGSGLATMRNTNACSARRCRPTWFLRKVAAVVIRDSFGWQRKSLWAVPPLQPRDHLRSSATPAGIGTISRSSDIARFVWGGVVKTFRCPHRAYE